MPEVGKAIAETSKKISKNVSESVKSINIDKRVGEINTNSVKNNDFKNANIEKRIGNKKEINTTKESFVEKNFDVKMNIKKNLTENIAEKKDKEKEYNERINQAKCSDGKWSGKIGESTLLLKTGEKVEYKKGYPNFDKYSKGDVKINNMTSDKDKNWANAKRAYAEKWNKECKDGKNDWTEKDVANYKRDNHLEFHECEDMKTCQLVPEYIHQNARHYGGRHECKIRGK